MWWNISAGISSVAREGAIFSGCGSFEVDGYLTMSAQRALVEQKKDSGWLVCVPRFGRNSNECWCLFSLFGLINRTVTKSGLYKLRQWMLTPLVDAALINERLDAVAFFSRAENEELRRFLVRLAHVQHTGTVRLH